MSTTHTVSPKTGERANPGRRALPRAAHILLEDERTRNDRQQFPARIRKCHGPMPSDEHLVSQPLLQVLNLSAYRTLGDRQLFGRECEAHLAPGAFETTKGREGNVAGHRMSSGNADVTINSFATECVFR